MRHFSVDSFFNNAIHDVEQCQYVGMDYLKECHNDFSKNKLYPTLAIMIDVVKGLECFLDSKNSLYTQLPRELKSIDLEKKELVYESTYIENPDIQRIAAAIEWFLPLLKEMVNEGMHIFDFVEENVQVEEVGIIPIYKDEGYCIVPELRVSAIHFVYYQLSLYTSGDEKFRALKTTIVESFNHRAVFPSPISMKQNFIKTHNELPNPATFICETDLDFPLQETILPVVKRKLMARLSSQTIH